MRSSRDHSFLFRPLQDQQFASTVFNVQYDSLELAKSARRVDLLHVLSFCYNGTGFYSSISRPLPSYLNQRTFADVCDHTQDIKKGAIPGAFFIYSTVTDFAKLRG